MAKIVHKQRVVKGSLKGNQLADLILAVNMGRVKVIRGRA